MWTVDVVEGFSIYEKLAGVVGNLATQLRVGTRVLDHLKTILPTSDLPLTIDKYKAVQGSPGSQPLSVGCAVRRAVQHERWSGRHISLPDLRQRP